MESRLLSIFVVGSLSIWRQNPYSLVFDIFLYSDLIWLIPNSFWFVSALISGFLLRMSEYRWILAGVCLLHEIWWFHILPRLPGYFSISESVLLERWCILFTGLLLSSTTTLEMRLAAVVSICSLLLTGIVLFCCRNRISCYTFIFFGALLEVLLLSMCVHQFFVSWLFQWVFESVVRPFFFLYWFFMLLLAFLVICGDKMRRQALIIQRKYFHILAVVLFLPVTLLDPPFMQ